MPRSVKFILLFLLLCNGVNETFAQRYLMQTMKLDIKKQKLSEVLAEMERQGNFRFSFNSDIVPVDSIVSITTNHLTVSEALDRLLQKKYEYKETHGFVIIRYAPFQLSIIIRSSYGSQNLYIISGQIIDHQSGNPIKNVSVYEKNILQSTLTNDAGMFTLRLRNISGTINMTASKEHYKDHTMLFVPEILVRKRSGRNIEDYLTGDLSRIENTRFGRFFITPDQKEQTKNLGGYISRAPVQGSLTPGLSTHGSLSGQVINKFSLNATGAYSAGVDGVEASLIFNINKSNMRYVQLAGIFNLVGGNVTGVQAAGLYNNVLDSVRGVQLSSGWNSVLGGFAGMQAAGLHNNVREKFHGVQLSAGYNRVGSTMKGFQAAGLSNFVSNHAEGVQISALANMVSGKFNGLQLGGVYNLTAATFKGMQLSAGINHIKRSLHGFQMTGALNMIQQNLDGYQVSAGVNYVGKDMKGLQFGGLNYAESVEGTQFGVVGNRTKKLEGVQIGLINIADSSSGLSVGVLNIIGDGYYRFSIAATELSMIEFSLHTGNRKLFTTITGGMSSSDKKRSSFGLGLGKTVFYRKRFEVNPGLQVRYIYQGDRNKTSINTGIQTNILLKVSKHVALQAGPSLNAYYSNQQFAIQGYEFIDHKQGTLSTWIGWNFGIAIIGL